jgi:molybdate transport system substrate-binding protein
VKKTSIAGLVLVSLAAVGLVGCLGSMLSHPSGSPAVEENVTLTLFAAASTGNALEEVLADFTRREGIEVQCSFAASSTLAQQITRGAGADLFVSANESWVDHLQQKGLVAQRQDLLSNRLVVVVPVGAGIDLQRPEDLAEGKIRYVALADPEGVPAGIYAKQALIRLGLWADVQPKVVSAANVRQALAFVETGAADAGIVYATDAALSRAVTVAARLEPSLSEPIRYPVVLLARAAGSPEAESLYAHLTSPATAEVFLRHGFSVVSPQTVPSP